MSKTEIIQLHEENLIPLYLIEDKLKDNFRNTNGFIQESYKKFGVVMDRLTNLDEGQTSLESSFNEKMLEMEKKIVHEISLELEGRIAIAIGKSIDSFTQKMDKKEDQMGDFKVEFNKKITQMKQDLKYEISQDNQKLIAKETKKLDDNIKLMEKKITKNINHPPPPSSIKSSTSYLQATPKDEEGHSWQQQHQMLKKMQERVDKLEQFSIGIDKRFYNNMTSLKDSWKQLGAELLQNKKSLIKKNDDLKMQFIKLKNLKQFSVAPDKVEETFKQKISQKFTNIYQLLSLTLTKNQYNSAFDRMSTRISRHDQQFLDFRKQMSANSQYFTFYMNNANQDDLKGDIENLKMTVQDNKQIAEDKEQGLKKKCHDNLKEIKKLEMSIGDMNTELNERVKVIERMNEVVSLVQGRIESLEDFNKFGPDKLETIHNALDGGFTATEKELISTKQKNVNSKQMKDMKVQIGKMKDQVFLLSSQHQIKDEELLQMKKMYQQLESKLEKVKNQNEEAVLTRKPWVCLSCDKQDRQKEHTRKQSKSMKKQPFKGFGPQKSSEKLLKVSPPVDERFEVYEKFRDKYLSDTVKLPDIVRDKLKDKQTSFHT